MLSLTACAGARRGILQLPGVEEDVGMIGIHLRGQFIEMVPWNGEVQASPLSKSLLCHCNPSPAALCHLQKGCRSTACYWRMRITGKNIATIQERRHAAGLQICN